MALSPQDTWLKVQNGLAFMAFAHDQGVMPCFVRLKFRAWATKYVVLWDLRSLPYLQLGPVPYSTMGFLALALKSYSQARRYCLYGPQHWTQINDLPLWHSTIFRNVESPAYYCPALIRKGILRIGELFDRHLCPQTILLQRGRTVRCARCAKSRPFSTTGRQFFGCRIAAGYYCHCVSL